MTKQERYEQVFIGMALMMAKECKISKRDAFNAQACWAHRCCERMRTGRDLRTGKPRVKHERSEIACTFVRRGGWRRSTGRTQEGHDETDTDLQNGLATGA